MMKTFDNFIAGQWRPGSAGATFTDENPAERGAVLARFQASAPADVTVAIGAAQAAFASARAQLMGPRPRGRPSGAGVRWTPLRLPAAQRHGARG